MALGIIFCMESDAAEQRKTRNIAKRLRRLRRAQKSDQPAQCSARRRTFRLTRRMRQEPELVVREAQRRDHRHRLRMARAS